MGVTETRTKLVHDFILNLLTVNRFYWSITSVEGDIKLLISVVYLRRALTKLVLYLVVPLRCLMVDELYIREI